MTYNEIKSALSIIEDIKYIDKARNKSEVETPALLIDAPVKEKVRDTSAGSLWKQEWQMALLLRSYATIDSVSQMQAETQHVLIQKIRDALPSMAYKAYSQVSDDAYTQHNLTFVEFVHVK